MLTAKPVIKNKFWIVEDDGTKIATIQSTEDGVVLVQNEQREKYPSVKLLSQKFNIQFDKVKKKQEITDNDIYGYPTGSKPYNVLFDVAKKLPIFTKTKKSKSFFCAGYYVVFLNDVWSKVMAPKLITVNRYKHFGPYRTDAEAELKLQDLENG